MLCQKYDVGLSENDVHKGEYVNRHGELGSSKITDCKKLTLSEPIYDEPNKRWRIYIEDGSRKGALIPLSQLSKY